MKVRDVLGQIIRARIQQIAVGGRAEALDEEAMVSQPRLHHCLDVLQVLRKTSFEFAHHHVNDVENLDVEVGKVRVQLDSIQPIRRLREERQAARSDVDV